MFIPSELRVCRADYSVKCITKFDVLILREACIIYCQFYNSNLRLENCEQIKQEYRFKLQVQTQLYIYGCTAVERIKVHLYSFNYLYV
jgi:hypothetical protein